MLCNVIIGNFSFTGVPDAPVSVQVESGPDHGCLMVSWLPVTITSAGTSNGARVAGYCIYIDGCNVKTLSNPTGISACRLVCPVLFYIVLYFHFIGNKHCWQNTTNGTD